MIELYSTGVVYAFLALLALCLHDSYKMWPLMLSLIIAHTIYSVTIYMGGW
jgi:hypothetical protein